MSKIARDLQTRREELAKERINVQSRIRKLRAHMSRSGGGNSQSARADLMRYKGRIDEIQQQEGALKIEGRRAWQLRWDRAFVNAAKDRLPAPLFNVIKATADRLMGRKPK